MLLNNNLFQHVICVFFFLVKFTEFLKKDGYYKCIKQTAFHSALSQHTDKRIINGKSQKHYYLKKTNVIVIKKLCVLYEE